MRYLKYFSNSLLIFSLPAMSAYPHPITAASEISYDREALHFLASDNHILTYDEIVNFIQEVEEGDLEGCSSEKLSEINLYLAHLAKAGFVSDEYCDEMEFESDIQELLQEDDISSEFAFASFPVNDYAFMPTYIDGQWKVIPCKSYLSKKWKQARKFINKHKTAIFVGAVVVAATVAIVLTVGAATPLVAPVAANAAAGVAAGSAVASNSSERNPSNTSKKEITPSIRPSEELPLPNALDPNIHEVVDQKFMQEEYIAAIKELLAENELIRDLRQFNRNEVPGFAEVARGVASDLIHQLYDEVASFIPPPLDLPKLSYDLAEDLEITPSEVREQFVAAGHQKIDQVFSTNLSDRFTPESKALNKTVIGIIPYPGAVGTVSVSRKIGQIAGTQATAVRGWYPGQPYNNLTANGTVPRWSTVRARYWKNQAHLSPQKYKPHELERMRQGLAPQTKNKVTGKMESKELHHDPAQKDGGLFDFMEVWPDEHAIIDNNRYVGS